VEIPREGATESTEVIPAKEDAVMADASTAEVPAATDAATSAPAITAAPIVAEPSPAPDVAEAEAAAAKAVAAAAAAPRDLDVPFEVNAWASSSYHPHSSAALAPVASPPCPPVEAVPSPYDDAVTLAAAAHCSPPAASLRPVTLRHGQRQLKIARTSTRNRAADGV
jgi:hypothetical protein